MFKIFICLFCALTAANAVAQDNYRIDDKSKKRSVCGLVVAKKPGLVVDVKKILNVPRFSRESNLRYNACPYLVTLKYHDIKMQFDFSDDPTLDQVRDFANGQGVTLRFGILNYDEKGWNVAEGYYEGKNPEIIIKESKNSTFVMSEFDRKDEHLNLVKNCINILVVGNDAYAGGGICKATASALAPLKTIFSGEPVLFFRK